MALTRINYNRLIHCLKQFTKSIPVPLNRLKFLFIIIVIIISTVQLFLLSTNSLTKSTTVPQIIVVDKNTPTSLHYKHLIKKYSENFPSLSLNKKCHLYFDELYDLDHNWEMTDPNKIYNKDTLDHDRFIRDKIKNFKNANDNKEPNDGQKAQFELDFQEALKTTLDAEQSMIDAVTHLRVFGNCFLNQRESSASETASALFNSWFGNTDEELDGLAISNNEDATNLDICYDIEQRLFPWLSRELPLFTRWDGTKVRGIPLMSNYISRDEYFQDDKYKQSYDELEAISSLKQSAKAAEEDTKKTTFAKRSPINQCFLNTWRKSLNGKGIVLSVADKYEHDIIGLLRVLRALNNRLPIQLVHKGDLSKGVQEKIVKVARSEDVKVPTYLYESIIDDIPHNFPKQEVWFVDAKRCIRSQYEGNFKGFANKLIAYLFNSFDDTILMDTDSVPLVKPATLLKSGPYNRTNTIFFKDRFSGEKVNTHDSEYFVKLMPSRIDESLFDIPQVGNVTLENRYIKNQFRHVMEAGMVGIKRSTHFIGVLTSVQLNFWSATSSRIWGDKELFWLGQSISGNENYEFNKYDVVAVGELTPMEQRPRNTIAHELCSTHPGHLSGDDNFTLLWINSGMRYCKVDNTWDGDLDQERFKIKFKDSNELAEMYKRPVRINAALIPPGGDRRKENRNNEPAGGWVMTPPCKGYLWCAYDIIGASIDPLDRGGYVEYDNITEYKNEYLGKLWLNQDLVDISKYSEVMSEERAKATQT